MKLEKDVLETKVGVNELNDFSDGMYNIENTMFNAFRKINDISNDFYGKYVNNEKDMDKKKKYFALNLLLMELSDEATTLYEKIRVASNELLDEIRIMQDREIDKVQAQTTLDGEVELDSKEEISIKDLKDKLNL